MAFHRKQVRESLSILDGLLRDNPEYVPALELKALNLKTLGREEQLTEVYEKLLTVKPEAERAPLHFELGALQQRFKKPKEARINLLKSIDAGFNLVPAHLLVGMIDFAAGSLADAERHLKYVRSEGASEMEVLATFYLGLINLKRGSGALGAGYVLDARDLAQKKSSSAMAREIEAPIAQILEPFKKSQWFSNVSFLGQYDTNILQIPTAATAQQGSGSTTAKSTVLAGFGYMSAPLAALQFVPSYRFNTNKNFSEAAYAYQYANNTVALALNVRPLGRVAGGLKGELTHTFQNQTKDANDSAAGYIYRQYSLSGDFGPYLKWTQSEDLQLLLEFSARPQVNFQQSDLGGMGLGTRLNYRRDGATRYFNPTLTLSHDRSGTRNTTYAAQATTVSVTNVLRLPGDYQLTLGTDYVMTRYPDAVPLRSDNTMTVRGNLARPINGRWTLLADLSFLSNSSNIPGTYSYTRWQAGFGASFSR